MPELPEVETIKRELTKVLPGKTISAVEVLWPKTVAPLTKQDFASKIIGQKVFSLDRRAKMLIIHLTKTDLIIHLKMTGQLIFTSKDQGLVLRERLNAKNLINSPLIIGGHPTPDIQTPGKHTRLIFTFQDNSKLYFNDLRKFGWVKILDEKLKKYISTELGLEPLSKTFAIAKVLEIFKKCPNRTVKQILLDQKLIAGIGNIYADESTFLSRILPMRKAKTLTEKEIATLYKNIIAVLKLSIKYKGTSSRNYRRSNGKPGNFIEHLMVYGRTKEKCKICRSLITKTKHAGRGTHYCTFCQK